VPAPAGIVSENKLEQFDAVEWTMENGARVIFRHADFQKDQVQIRGYSPGGASLYEDEWVPSVEMTPDMASFYGVGDFDVSSLQKMLTGKNVNLSLSVGGLSEGINGSSTPRDLEVLMQWIYLSFLNPRFDQDAHDAFMARLQGYVMNLRNDPQTVMGDSLNLISTNYHPRTRILDTEYLEDVKYDWVQQVYKERFADASDFFFVIVGNMEAEEVKILAQKYLGAIPDLNRTETWMDRKVREPEGVVQKTITMPLQTPKANVNIVINQETEYSAYSRVMMEVIQGILDLRYVESIREDEGGTYGVGVRASVQRWPVNKGVLRIRFDCDPDRADDLKSKVYLELDKLVSEGPTQEDLSKSVENLLKNREQARENNGFYMNAIYSYYIHGINLYAAENYEDILNDLSTKDVKKFMKSFYKDPNIVDVVFLPENAEAEAEPSASIQE
jgi:zinc protease